MALSKKLYTLATVLVFRENFYFTLYPLGYSGYNHCYNIKYYFYIIDDNFMLKSISASESLVLVLCLTNLLINYH